MHVGTLNRKSRPPKSLGDPLCELMKIFKGLIQEFGRFCEYVSAFIQSLAVLTYLYNSRAYYETRAPESSLSKQPRNASLPANLTPFTEHLLHWKSNRNGLNGFADRIAQLKKDLTSLLSQQAVPHPGKHADALAQIESRLTENRVFYGTIMDANEEIAESFLSKHGGEASVRLVSLNFLFPVSELFLRLLGPGRHPLEATGWCSGGERHAEYYKRYKEKHSDDPEASREDYT